jgi:FtsH-binding integral membrane protein
MDLNNIVLRCVTRNLIVMMIGAIVVVLSARNIPMISDALVTPPAGILSLALMLGGLAMIVMRQPVQQILVVIYVGTLLSLAVTAAHEKDRVVVRALCFALVFFAAFFVAGVATARVTGGNTLYVALLFLIGILITELLLPTSSQFNRLVAAVSASLFCAFTFYHANQFSRHCRGEDCCAYGTLTLWLDFANLFGNTLQLEH